MGKSVKKKLGRKVECTLCGKILSDRRNLNRHLRCIHHIQPKARRLSVKCSFSEDCSFICATSTVLRSHLESVHGFNIVQKELHFDSRSDFEKWKEEEETKTCASYVADTGVKYRKQRKIFYLRCHRSGPSRAELNGKKERIRSKPLRGYTQCGLTCPSTMQVVENQNGEIDVSYFPNHLGHKMDDESVKYMKLRRKEREEIAAKLVQGEPVSKIVCDARVNRSQQLSRVNFLQRRDVYNIKSKVIFLEKENDEDGRNIDSWVSQLHFNSSDDNPIAMYKPIDANNGYVLILIHPIQKMTFSLFDGSIIYVKSKKGRANIDFHLTAVYIINENGDGYPLGFCISSKSDYPTVSSFFRVIFDTFGTITPQIFISENFNYYYVAWKTIMGEVEDKLICNFNIHSHWEKKLLELKCPFEKHDMVSEKLKSLLRETDPDIFDSELVQVLNSWSRDDDLKLFVKYFYKSYCKKPYEWANCYRVHSVRKENINNYLEPLYIQTEQIYTEGTKNIHDALNSVLFLIRDECYMNLVRRDGNILVDKMKQTENNHSASEDVTDIIFNGNNWIIRHLDKNFIINKRETNCAKGCNILCYNCDICLHNFNCSCNDYLINFNICVHIHAVIRWNSSKKVDIKHFPKEKYLSSAALKFSAVSLSKSITKYLQQSEMTDLEYDKIILDLDKLIKEHSLKERFEENSLRKLSWDIWRPNLELVSELEASGGILSLAACDNILYSCSTAEIIQIWDLNSGKSLGQVSSTLFQPQKLYVDKASKILWAGDSQGNVGKYEDGKECGRYEMVEEIWDIMVSNNPTLIYTARDRDVVISELVTGPSSTRVLVKSTLQGRSPFTIAGNHLCFLNREGRNILIHENSLEKKFPLVNEIPASEFIVNAIASVSDNIIYTGGYDSTVKKWDISTQKCTGSVNLNSCVNAIAEESENNAFIATSDGNICLVGA